MIPSTLSAARDAELSILAELDRRGFGEAAMFAVKLAMEEALNNAIRHGNCRDETKTIDINYDVDDARAAIAITDQGQGFDPHSLPDPTADENLEKPSGRGVMLMRAYMDEVRFNERGNQVYMLKRNS